jgi:hypothetical protein
MQRRMTVAGLAVAALTVLASACSGGGDSTSDGGTGGGDFCSVAGGAAADIARLESMDPEASASEIESTFTASLGSVKDMQAVAPEALSADFDVMVPILEDVRSLLEDADWDVFAAASDQAAAERLGALDSVEYRDAQDRITEFAKAECDVQLGTDDASAGTEVPTQDTTSGDASSLAMTIGQGYAEGAGVVLDDAQQACVGQAMLDEFGFDGLIDLGRPGAEPTSDQLQQVVGVFDTCSIDLSGLANTDGSAFAAQFAAAVASSAGFTLSPEQETCVGNGILDVLDMSRLVELGAPGAEPSDEEIQAVIGVLSSCGVG